MVNLTMPRRSLWVRRALTTSLVIMGILGITLVGYTMYSGIRILSADPESANAENVAIQPAKRNYTAIAVKGVNNVANDVDEVNETNRTSDELNQDEFDMIKLVNKERVARGLNELQIDMQLVHTARVKAQDMIDQHYFDHQSPVLGSPFAMFKRAGMQYIYAGENLAGSANVHSAHSALMNSPTHRDNILFKKYTHIGVGEIGGGPYGKMFVQHFMAK